MKLKKLSKVIVINSNKPRIPNNTKLIKIHMRQATLNFKPKPEKTENQNTCPSPITKKRKPIIDEGDEIPQELKRIKVSNNEEKAINDPTSSASKEKNHIELLSNEMLCEKNDPPKINEVFPTSSEIQPQEASSQKTDNKTNSKFLEPLNPITNHLTLSPEASKTKIPPTSSIVKTEIKETKDISQKFDPLKDKLFSLKTSSDLKPLHHKSYNPIKDAIFNKDEPVPFCLLSSAFEEASKCKGENSKEFQKNILSNMFQSIIFLKPEHLIMSYYLCILKITPDYIPSETGIGNEILVKAVSKITGRSEKQIRDSVNKVGDLGTVAAESKATQSTISSFFNKNKKNEEILTVKKVFETFLKLAHTKGNSADKEKESLLIKLLFEAKGDEIKFIVRWINKNFKIGMAEASMQSALAKTFCLINHDKNKENFNEKLEEYETILKRCICEFPNYDKIIESLLQIGPEIRKLLDICKITPGVPVKPMLAKPTKEIAIIFKRFENMKFTCEYKYDGLRGQIHYHDGICDIFSRNLLNMTETYPDIIEFVKSHTKENVRNFIMDSEIVAIDTRTNRILPFQQLSTRSKKNVDKNEIEINVCLYMFDLLYLNDQSLLQEPLQKRRELIRENFEEVENKLSFAQYIDSENIDEIQDFLNESVKMGCEGLMVKTLDTNSTYEPAKRSFKWLKLKKDYLDKGLGDTLDLVPIGAFFGTGKRTGLYGSFLLACYNDDMECYETICKTGTGFSDERLDQIYKFLSERKINAPLPDYKTNDFQVDVWFEPCVVWEIKAADLQISPVYTAGIGDVDPKKGIGLRFPRLIKIREDKKPIEASTSKMIIEIYQSQAVVGNMEFRDDDDY